MSSFDDELAGLRAGADQLSMLWSDVMPVVRSLYDAAVKEGFSDEQAHDFCRSYFLKLLGAG